MATTTPNFGWPVPTSTDLVKDGATAIEALGDGVDASMVDLKGGLTGQVLAKTTNADMDFTWVTTDDANAIQNSIVDAKGDLIGASANDTPARLAVGNNGETLVADSSTSTGLRWQGSAIGKNCVFNSGFDIFQRSATPTTGITTAGGVEYSLDRWVSWTITGTGSMNASQQVTGDTTNLPFVRYCARVQRTAGNTSTSNLEFAQALENTDSARFIGQTVTFSFYARKGANYSGASSTLAAIVQTGTGTDQSWWNMTGTAQPISTSTTLTATWQRFQYTATLSASATQVGFGFRFAGVGTAGAADYYEVTGVQLELGSIATPYAKMGSGSVQSELSACQRYYYLHSRGNDFSVMQGSYESASIVVGTIFYPVTMRSAPVLFASSGTNYYMAISSGNPSDTLNSFTITNSSVSNAVVFNSSEASGTAGQALRVKTNNASSSIAFGSELS
tara:strand:- start:367 stop:1710 length:1344 start_codon:yes stop_codon:yes gene_type:complete